MATNNIINSPLSGTTGTGTFVGSTSATLVTPTLGSATATQVTFSPTTGGIVGTTTNNNASSGIVGEFVSSTINSGSSVSLTTATSANVTSISLTAGDWDVWGNVGYTPAGTTSITILSGWISSTSASQPDTSLRSDICYVSTGTVLGSSETPAQAVPYVRFSLSGTTTVYLSARAVFTVSTLSAYGGIYARRAR